VTFFDGEPGAEGYCLATKFQAMIVFRDAKKLVASSGLKEHIKSTEEHALSRADSEQKLEPLGANPEDGLNPHLSSSTNSTS
jgi:hypothetical protein